MSTKRKQVFPKKQQEQSLPLEISVDFNDSYEAINAMNESVMALSQKFSPKKTPCSVADEPDFKDSLPVLKLSPDVKLSTPSKRLPLSPVRTAVNSRHNLFPAQPKASPAKKDKKPATPIYASIGPGHS